MEDLYNIPPQFLCPITREIMLEPCIAKDGNSYEKSAIATWFSNHNTSPLTNEIIYPEIILNIALKQLIEDWKNKLTLNSHYCSLCRKKTNIIHKCSGCFQRFYCSKNCKNKSWILDHNEECLGLSRKLKKELYKCKCNHVNITIQKTDFEEINFICLDCGLNELEDVGILSEIYLHRRTIQNQVECEHNKITCKYHKINGNKSHISTSYLVVPACQYKNLTS